jgi:hypothetical protein
MPDLTLPDIAELEKASAPEPEPTQEAAPAAQDPFATVPIPADQKKEVVEEAKKIPSGFLGGLINFGSESAQDHKDDRIFGDGNTFRLINPSTGETKDVSPDASIEHFEAGWQFQDPNAQMGLQAHINAFQDKPELMQNIAAGLHAAGTFGSSTIDKFINPIDNPNTNNNERYAVIANRILSSDFPISNVAGTGSSYFGAGLLAEALAAPAIGALVGESIGGAGIGGAALRGALTGAGRAAAFTTPQAAVQAMIDKDPEGAAQSLLLSAGIGSVLSGAGGALAKSLETASGKPSLQKLFNPEAVLSSKEQVWVAKKMANFSESGARWAKKYLIDQGIALNKLSPSIIEHFGSLGAPLDDVLDKMPPEQRSELFNTLSDLPGKNIKDELIDLAAGKGLGVAEKLDAVEGASELSPKLSTLEDSIKDFRGEAPKTAEDLMGSAKKLADEDGALSLNDTRDMIDKINGNIDWDAPVSDRANELQKIFVTSASRELFRAAEDIAQKAGDVKLINEVVNARAAADFADKIASLPKIEQEAVEASSKQGILGLAGKVANKIAGSTVRGIGYAHGGIAGGVAAGEVYEAAKNAVKGFVETHIANSDTKIAPFLNKMVDHSAVASFVIGDAIHIANKKIDDIPVTIKSSLNEPPTPPPNMIKFALGDQANGVSTAKQFEKYSTHVAQQAGNPDLMDATLRAYTQPMEKDHPKLAADYRNSLAAAINYIHSVLPKPPVQSSAFYIAPAWQPTAAQMNNTNGILEVIHNPMALAKNAVNGTITDDQIKAVETLYPRILEKMRDSAVASSTSIKTNYQHRIGLSKFLGQPIEPSLVDIASYQAAYTSQSPQQPQQAPAKRSRGGSKMNAEKLPAAQYTMGQRLMK